MVWSLKGVPGSIVFLLMQQVAGEHENVLLDFLERAAVTKTKVRHKRGLSPSFLGVYCRS